MVISRRQSSSSEIGPSISSVCHSHGQHNHQPKEIDKNYWPPPAAPSSANQKRSPVGAEVVGTEDPPSQSRGSHHTNPALTYSGVRIRGEVFPSGANASTIFDPGEAIIPAREIMMWPKLAVVTNATSFCHCSPRAFHVV